MASGRQTGVFSSPDTAPERSPPRSSQGEAVHVVDLVREVLLPLLGQEAEARAADDPVDHVQVAAHAAVHVVQDHALLGHVVLDDHDAVGSEASLAAPQELRQVLVGQVACGAEARSREGAVQASVACSRSLDPSRLGSLPHTLLQLRTTPAQRPQRRTLAAASQPPSPPLLGLTALPQHTKGPHRPGTVVQAWNPVLTMLGC